MPTGFAKPFSIQKTISLPLPPHPSSHVMGCFHGIKLSLVKWALVNFIKRHEFRWDFPRSGLFTPRD